MYIDNDLTLVALYILGDSELEKFQKAVKAHGVFTRPDVSVRYDYNPDCITACIVVKGDEDLQEKMIQYIINPYGHMGQHGFICAEICQDFSEDVEI